MGIKGISKYYTTGHEIERSTDATGGFGGFARTWSSHLSPAGRLRPLSGDQQLSADKETAFATHRFYCAPDDIKVTDRYKDPDGNIYRIKFVSDVMNMDNHLQVDLEYQGHLEATST